MSDDDPDPETVETVDEPGDEEDELPEMGEEDMADFEEVAQQAAESADDEETDGDDDQQDEGADDQQDAPAIDFGGGDEQPIGTGSWGDLYVEGLTVGLNQVIEAKGKPGADQIEESLPRQIGLDDAFDEMMAKRGKSELPPEQHVLYGSLGLAVIVIVSKTEVPSELADNLGDMEAGA